MESTTCEVGFFVSGGRAGAEWVPDWKDVVSGREADSGVPRVTPGEGGAGGGKPLPYAWGGAPVWLHPARSFRRTPPFVRQSISIKRKMNIPTAIAAIMT